MLAAIKHEPAISDANLLRAIEAHEPDARIIATATIDLDECGQFADRKFVATQICAYSIEKGNVLAFFPFDRYKNFRVTVLVGGALLEAVCDGNSETAIARGTMRTLSEMQYIAGKICALQEKDTAALDAAVPAKRVCETCGRTLSHDSSICRFCLKKGAIILRLLSASKSLWPYLIIAAMLFWVVSGLRIAIPQIYRVLIDEYLTVQRNAPGQILGWIGGLALCNLAIAGATMLRSWLMNKAGGFLARDLRAMIFGKLQALSLNYLTQKKAGDLMNRVTRDTRKLQEFIQSRAATGINEMLTLVVVGCLLFARNWRLAVLVLFPAPLVLYLCFRVRKWIRLRYRRQNTLWDEANSMLQEIFSGIRVIKAFGREDREVQRFRDVSLRLAHTTASNERSWNTLFPALGYLMGIGNFFVLFYGGALVIGEEMKTGELVLYTQYAAMIYGPLNWISFFPRWFGDAAESAGRFFEIVDEEIEVQEHHQAVHQRLRGSVYFEKVTFGYRVYEPVLKSIDLSVEPGEMIGLVGHSGAGKSTLINLLLRFYDVNAGRIRIDGKDIKELSQQTLRSQIGVVLQETFLFSGTVFENILYSKPDATPDQVIRAARVANAHDFIMRFPDGYDTRVGEKGHRLSGGERQRIAIARAILHDPAILILDEATAAVDTETEQQIQEALLRLIRNRTTFAIAHRLSTLRHAHRLVVLGKGSIIELGSHRDLMKKKGVYFRLVMAQRRMARVRDIGDKDAEHEETH